MNDCCDLQVNTPEIEQHKEWTQKRRKGGATWACGVIWEHGRDQIGAAKYNMNIKINPHTMCSS